MPAAREKAAAPAIDKKPAPRKRRSGGAKRAARKNANPKPKQLTVKQQLFVESYLGTARGNGTEAAKLAGYAAKNRNSLHAASVEVLSLPHVQAAIDKRLAEAKKCFDADTVLERLTDQAQASIDDFLDGTKLDLDKARRLRRMHLIKKIAWTKDGIRLELHDSHAALVDLGRYHKLFTERHEHTDPDGGPIKHQHGLDDDAKQLLAKLLGVHPGQLPSKETERAES